MKHFWLIAILVFSYSISYAQKKKKAEDNISNETSPAADPSLVKSYELAMGFGDYEAGKNVIYLILANDTSLAWQDSLIRIYFTLGAYPQAVLAARNYVERDPKNQTVLELLAASEYSLKFYKESLADYEKLFRLSGSVYHAYQIAINQYMLQRYAECETTIQFLLIDKTSEKEQILINLNNGESQRVPLRAAAWNLRGVILKDMNKPADARTCFEEALKIYPDFVLAQGNMQAVSAEPPKPEPAPAAEQKKKK